MISVIIAACGAGTSCPAPAVDVGSLAVALTCALIAAVLAWYFRRRP